jgi:hypothetical protein
MCELYCPADALYVAPESDTTAVVNEQELAAIGLLGSYRENVGWKKGHTSTAKTDQTYQLLKYIK